MFSKRVKQHFILFYSNQLLSENKLYSLNSIYNFCALNNLQFRFQEKNLNLNRSSIILSDLFIVQV